MKRTPLKQKTPLRAGSPLRSYSSLNPGKTLKTRTALPRKRKKARHNQSRSEINKYLEENNDCEFDTYGTLTPPGGHSGPLDPHHIARIRHDRPECLLSLCRQCHEYGHDNDADFIVWCAWTKWKKGELNLEILNQLKRGMRLEFAINRRELFILEETWLMSQDLMKAKERCEI